MKELDLQLYLLLSALYHRDLAIEAYNNGDTREGAATMANALASEYVKITAMSEMNIVAKLMNNY